MKTNYLSVDPYMRGRISEAKSYAEPVQIGEVMVGGTVGTVVESRHPGYRPGEVVVGYWGWQEYAVSDGQGIERFDTSLAPMSTALGVLGMPGMTAYFGLLEIGKPQAGRDGLRFRRRRGRGLAGRPDRQDPGLPRGRLGRIPGESGLPHRRVGLRRGLQLQGSEGLRRQAPGSLPQGNRRVLRQRGRPADRRRVHPDQRRRRIVICGQIDQYNATRPPRGPRLLWHLIVKQARVEGFLVFDFAGRFHEGQQQMAQWIKEGKMKYRETIVDGLEHAPKAFIGLFHGENVGKQLVRVAKEQ